MRFSIIVPVYNVERYLEYCLNSIAQQDYFDYEVVIVDDGSTDGSSAIYERLVSGFSVPVQIIKQQNGGLLSARRTGIKAAKGDYLWHVDGDDAIAPHAMRRVGRAIDCVQPDLVLIGLSESSNYDYLLPGFMPGEKLFYRNDEINIVRHAFLQGYIPNLVMKIARRSCVDVERDYSEYGRLQLGEDQLQSLCVLDRAKSVLCLKEPLYYYRTNEDSISARYREGQVTQYSLVKDSVYRQAVIWDEKWPGMGFSETALDGYLSNAYYDMRKSADLKLFRRQFQELRDTELYKRAVGRTFNLRGEQKLFFTLLLKKLDMLAFLCLLVCRFFTPFVRKVKSGVLCTERSSSSA